jgi:TonB-linked SusC/RagA family outer membrane protein
MKKKWLTSSLDPGIGKKWRRIMRITAILIFGLILTVNANSYSQVTKFNIRLSDSSIRDVFKYVEENSKYVFLYKSEDFNVDERNVDVNLKNATINEILDEVLAGEKVVYDIYDRQIIIRKSDKTELSRQQQSKSVTGVVIDDKGLPLPGVTVLIKGTTQGTVTNDDGEYSLTDVPNGATLQYSFVGMVMQEVTVGNQTIINITMVTDAIGLEEVIAIGYGTQKKVNVTGSVASISTEQISNRPVPKMGEVLRGLSPNLNVGLSSAGGEPGASSKWNVRGLGSLSGNDSPLILVDGVQMNINNIDPANVESVSVLKDASASAIYGARAPFGVILITTKKGKSDGSISVQYNNNFSFGTPLGIGHLESSIVYAEAYNQASINAGSPPIYDEEYLARIQGYIDGTYPTEYDPDNPPHNIWAGRRVGNANYDWPHEWVKDVKMDQKHSLNISGGNKKTQYYASAGYYDQDGFIAHGYDDYKRLDFLINLNSQITNWLSFNVSSKFANTNTDYPHGITTVAKNYMWHSLYTWSPMTPKYNINGSIANPWIRSQESSGRIKTSTNDFLLTLGTELEPIKGWKTNLSYTYNLVSSYMESNPKPVWVELGTGEFGNVGKPNATYNSKFAQSPYTLFNAITSYEKSLDKHYFKVLVGYEQEDKFYTALEGAGGILISEEVPSISTSLGASTVDDTKWDWSTQGYFGRFNYNYEEKYLLEVSARYNGSSRFAPESRWGFFPSGSVGYQISKEDFWSNIEPYINTLKIRASYGSLGNQNVYSYLYIPSVPIYSETPWIIGGERPAYARTPHLISDNLTWETVTTTNFGIDAAFLNNRLELNFDWFNRTTTDMFGPSETLPYTLGTSTPKANNASLETKGFELILRWKDRISSDFSYNAQISVGDAKSTILEYRNESEFINDWYPGKNVGEIWGLTTDAIIQTDGEAMPDQSDIYPRWGAGDIKYKDLDGDNKITYGNSTLDDHGDLSVIGNTTPRYNIGLTAGATWKNFDFSMQWFGYLKRDYAVPMNNALFQGLTSSWASSGITKDSKTMDYWRPADETNMFGPNTNSYFAKPYFSRETFKNQQTQSKYILNAGFFRMKYIQVGYTLPELLSKKAFIKNARIYVSGENLLTIKSLPGQLDPESSINPPKLIWGSATTGGGFYPMARTYSIGVNLKF